jgi:hypothetical protein
MTKQLLPWRPRKCKRQPRRRPRQVDGGAIVIVIKLNGAKVIGQQLLRGGQWREALPRIRPA